MFALAIFFARKIFGGAIFEIIFCVVGFCALFLICLKFKCIKRFVLIFCAFLVGLGYFYVGMAMFVGETYTGEKTISGRVFDVSDNVSYMYVNLDNVSVDEKHISHNIMAYIPQSLEIENGDVLTFRAELKNIKSFELEKFSTQNYKANIAYTCKVSGNINISSGYKTISENINQSVTDFTHSHFSSEIAWLFEAVILGDKENLSKNISQDFSAAGIGHLLAVSGLHVGFIVAILTVILSKLKIKRKYCAIILTFLLFAYCYLCGFSPSVVRASIMSLVFVYAYCLGKKYDALNCLAISGFIILFIKPLYVFDAGFLLSFLSVFCIFTLCRPLCKLLLKIKFPTKFAQVVSLTLCVQIGLLPIMAVYYSEFSILSLFANLICVPLFQIAHIIAFICLPVCMLLPFMIFVLKFDEFLFSVIAKIANIVACAKWSFVSLYNMKLLFVISFYISGFVLSGYVMLKTKLKAVISALVFAIGVLMSAICNLPADCHKFTMGACIQNNNTAYVITYGGEVVVVADEYDDKLDRFLKIQNINKIDYLFCLSDIDGGIYDIYNNITIINYKNFDKNQSYNLSNFKYKFVCVGQNLCAIDITLKNQSYLFFKKSNLTYAEIYGLQYEYLGKEIAVCVDLNKNIENFDTLFDCENYVYSNKIFLGDEQIEIENWTSEFKNDMLKFRSLDWITHSFYLLQIMLPQCMLFLGIVFWQKMLLKK